MTKAMMTKYGLGTFFSAIHDYLEVYLPEQRNLSKHTIDSYRETLNQLVDFVTAFNKSPMLDVTFEMLTAETVTAFLDSLEHERGNSISSRNTRLAAIKAFAKYAADRNIAYAAIREELKKVTVKKPNKIEKIEYMSMDAISAIVDQTDLSSPDCPKTFGESSGIKARIQQISCARSFAVSWHRSPNPLFKSFRTACRL